jgi:hypothetical protein
MLKPEAFKRVEIPDVACLLDYRQKLPSKEAEHYWLFRGMPSDFPRKPRLSASLSMPKLSSPMLRTSRVSYLPLGNPITT